MESIAASAKSYGTFSSQTTSAPRWPPSRAQQARWTRAGLLESETCKKKVGSKIWRNVLRLEKKRMNWDLAIAFFFWRCTSFINSNLTKIPRDLHFFGSKSSTSPRLWVTSPPLVPQRASNLSFQNFPHRQQLSKTWLVGWLSKPIKKPFAPPGWTTQSKYCFTTSEPTGCHWIFEAYHQLAMPSSIGHTIVPHRRWDHQTSKLSKMTQTRTIYNLLRLLLT